jgi:glycosyltransferase involved in cell wall biosynthesis
MNCVDIVMATYNGEKYLAAQIDSLLGQTYKNWRLLITDDGSTDRTLDILRCYAKTYNQITIVNTERQGGVVKNFSKGLTFCTSPYIMFCDQDDIWLTNKISSMVDAMKVKESSLGKGTPLLGFSDLCLVDEYASVIHNSFYQYNRLNPNNNLDYGYLLWRSTVYGCTVIFNKELLHLAMPLPDDISMHDQWFALIAAKYGSLFFLPESLIYYRQHCNNVVGGAGTGFWSRIFSMKRLYSNIKNASIKCVNQSNHLASGRWGGVQGVEAKNVNTINSLSRKIEFIKLYVLPYWSERKFYSIIFCLALLNGRFQGSIK